MTLLFHSRVPPSAAARRARGTKIATAPERARQRALAVAVAVALRRCGCLAITVPLVALAQQAGLELLLQDRLDERADLPAYRIFQRIEPALALKNHRLRRTRGRQCDISRHSVISAGAPTPVLACKTSRRLRHPRIPTTFATAPPRRP